MAAEHLPRDLMQPSSGYKELSQKKITLVTYSVDIFH